MISLVCAGYMGLQCSAAFARMHTNHVPDITQKNPGPVPRPVCQVICDMKVVMYV